jgi:glycine/D-amino acid oxidase-like deaminating enzyme
MLAPNEVSSFVRASDPLGASFTPHGARIDPARLARGLAAACERLGVTIHEGTPAEEIAPKRVRCPGGTITADVVVRATEAYTTQVRGEARRYLPLYSLMIATEPLPTAVLDELAWADGLTVSDQHHLFFYAQLTTDGRIAIGGRGAPYRLGAPISEQYERNDAVRRRLVESIRRHFPAAGDAAITHAWGGPLGVPRDWCMSVVCDRRNGFAWAGGYSGHGVVAAGIAGRTLADLILDRRTELVDLPWVGHVPRRWEPEPLRYLASRSIVGILGSADRAEDRTGRWARRTTLVKPFVMSR